MRQRDPRRLIARRRRARALVKLGEPQSEYATDGSIGSKQTAEVTMPRAQLDRVWSAEYLERLARTYWHFLSRISLGLLRVLYTETSREVVLLRRPFVLLRFRAPEYETEIDCGSVTWPIDEGLLVAASGRDRGLPARHGAPLAAHRRLRLDHGDGHLGGGELLPRDRGADRALDL